MTLIKFGNGSLIMGSSISGNISVKKDSTESVIEVGDNAKIINSNLNNNEEHTEESYAIKITASRNAFYDELEAEISKLENESTKTKLKTELTDLKSHPTTPKGQWQWNQALNKFKEFSIELGAKIVAEIAMKQLGY